MPPVRIIHRLSEPIKPRYFHGGVVELQPGDLVLPWKVHQQAQTMQSGTSYAWATPFPQDAVFYARAAQLKHGGIARVYEVQPNYQLDLPAPAKHHGLETGWRVVGQVWSQTPEEHQAQIARADAFGRLDTLRWRRLNLIKQKAKNTQISQAISPETAEILRLLRPIN